MCKKTLNVLVVPKNAWTKLNLSMKMQDWEGCLVTFEAAIKLKHVRIRIFVL